MSYGAIPVGLSGITNMPTQAIKEWTDDDYKRNLLFIASSWNRILYNFSPNAAVAPNGLESVYWVNDYLRNASYFFGKNLDTQYQFATKDETNNPLPIPMFNGQDVASLIKHTVGVIEGMVRDIPEVLNCESTSEDLQSKKKLLRDLSLFKIREKTFVDIAKELGGIDLQPIADMDFNNIAEVEQYFQNYKDALEKIYVVLARYCFQYNYGNEFFKKNAEYWGIGGIVHARIYSQNGKVKWRRIEPQNAIWDNYQSDDQHRADRFAGEYFQKSVPELLTMFKFTPQEREEMEALAKAGTTQWANYNVQLGNNLYWWQTSPSGVPMVAIVHGQWRSLKYEGLDDEGNEIWSPCLREGYLIGNRFIKEYGESKNQIADKTNPSNLRLNYITASNDTVLGVCVGIAGRLREYQKLKDFFQTKLNQLIANSKGKRYVMYQDKLPEGMQAPDMLAQLSQAGIVVLPSRDMDDPEGNRGLIETVDMTLDPSIVGLLQVINYQKTYMEDIISMPAASRGLVSNYQSKDAMKMNLESASKGMSSYYSTYYTWILRMLEYSADLAKLVMAEEDTETMQLLVGDANVSFVKTQEIKEMSMLDFAMSFGLNDFITDMERGMFIQYYMQRASATNDPEDELVFANISRIKTKTEMYSYIESVVAQKIQRKQQEMLAQQQQQQAMAEQAANAQIQGAQIAQDTALEGQAMKQEGEMEKMILDSQLNPPTK